MHFSIERQAAFRDTIENFLKERLDAKLDKHSPDDPKRSELTAQHAAEAWLESTARGAGQLQNVTHLLKATHPSARGTNLFRSPEELPAHMEVGSHVLDQDFDCDVVGTAGALAINKLLKLPVEGHTLLAWMQAGDRDLLAVLSDDTGKAQERIDAFTGITAPRRTNFSSHTLAKQIFWLVGDDPADNSHYHLLAPLYSSALSHKVFETINEDRFGEAGKIARQARREGRDHNTGYREYPDLAVQKLGGDNAQNISQLNSERGGMNYLLASRPPKWKAPVASARLLSDSVFPRFGEMPEARHTVRVLSDFLTGDPRPNRETRNYRDALLDRLIDELVDFVHPLQTMLPAGWTREAHCELVEAEKLWLDPRRAQAHGAMDADFRAAWQRMDWPAEVGRRFGNWLNHELGQTLPLGDIEGRHWQNELLLHTGWAGSLHGQRVGPDGPPQVRAREGGP